MFRRMLLLTVLTFGLFGCQEKPQIHPQSSPMITFSDEASSALKAKHEAKPIRIRLLILKHSREYMADGDANLAIEAAERAAAKGLHIKTVGNHFIDSNGKMRVSTTIRRVYSLPELKQFVVQEMKASAEDDDTLIVFTIGHGFPGGQLDNLGDRKGVMNTLADAAEDNEQRTFWWQLSCHAMAGLPGIDTLPEKQQELFCMLATSTASETSAAYVQGKIMEQVFVAMADRSTRIDPDQNGEITGRELRTFLNETSRGRGDLFFTRNLAEDVIFGERVSLANKIPIVDRNESQKTYPKDYIPFPMK